MNNSNVKDVKISSRVLNRSMNLSIIAGTGFTLWFSVASTQPIFNVFFTNVFGATSAQLGLLVSLIQLSAVFHLMAIFVYGSLRTRKTYFIIMHLIHRVFALILAFVAFMAGRKGVQPSYITLIIISVSLSWVFSNSSAAGWWSWMADLIPERMRGTFFGRRSSIMQIVNIIWFMGVSILLDTLTSFNLFNVYGVIFLFGAAAGILDIVLFIFVPEPPSEDTEKISISDFFEPLGNRNFLLSAVTSGLGVFAINVFAPFTSPYITSPDAVGAPNTWLGIMFVISQMMWILTVPFWGIVMDRFGRKPVVMMGCLVFIGYLGYVALGPGNYIFLLPVIALSVGLFAPAFWEGLNQLMLSLTPSKNRTAYVSWNFAIIGLVSSGGAVLGGTIKDRTARISYPLTENFSLTSIHFILFICVFLLIVTMILFSFVKETRGKELGFVVNRIARPGIFRTFASMGTLAGTGSSRSVARALRSIDDSSQDLVLDDVMDRLYDPDPDVREEAARALGRIGSNEAVEALVDQLRDSESTIRTQAARALGKIGNRDALPYLLEGINDPSEDVQNACTLALGYMGDEESVRRLLSIIRNMGSDRLAASGADAAGKLGAIEAVWEIVPRLHSSLNPVLTGQLSIALANLLGEPGRFYRLVTGKSSQRESNISSLFASASRRFPQMLKRIGGRAVDPDLKGEISRKLKSVKRYFDEEEYLSSFAILREAVSMIARFLAEGETEVGDYFRKLYLLDRKTALWWWFVQEASHLIDEATEEVVKNDILIILFFLAGKPESDQ
ncbi:MAG: HEAT repeat domain-containing protein [Spirochaetales bacterium]|nr:HEAT repeat domain-containing protein [Spirochaetales bacterium]